jgi:hypothetical protein
VKQLTVAGRRAACPNVGRFFQERHAKIAVPPLMTHSFRIWVTCIGNMAFAATVPALSPARLIIQKCRSWEWETPKT